jgi:hypothetical protein
MASPRPTDESDFRKAEKSFSALSALFTPEELELRAHAIVAASDRRLAAEAEAARSTSGTPDPSGGRATSKRRKHKRKHRRRSSPEPQGSVSEHDDVPPSVGSPPEYSSITGDSVSESTSRRPSPAPASSISGAVSEAARGFAESAALRLAVLARASKADLPPDPIHEPVSEGLAGRAPCDAPGSQHPMFLQPDFARPRARDILPPGGPLQSGEQYSLVSSAPFGTYTDQPPIDDRLPPSSQKWSEALHSDEHARQRRGPRTPPPLEISEQSSPETDLANQQVMVQVLLDALKRQAAEHPDVPPAKRSLTHSVLGKRPTDAPASGPPRKAAFTEHRRNASYASTVSKAPTPFEYSSQRSESSYSEASGVPSVKQTQFRPSAPKGVDMETVVRMLQSCGAAQATPTKENTPFKAPLPQDRRPLASSRKPRMYTTSDHGSELDDLEPSDSVSRHGRREPEDSPPVNPLAQFSGLEHSLLTGLATAIPKERESIAPSPLAESFWFFLRGFGLRSQQIVKADVIQRKWCSESAGAFRPAVVPPELPLPRSVKTADEDKAAKQRTYAAPAHALSTVLAELDTFATIPLREVLLTVSDPLIRQKLQGVLDFMSGRMSVLMGAALRSLASNFNGWHNQRRDAVLRSQSMDVQDALTPFSMGFRNLFCADIRPALATAANTAQLRLLTESVNRSAKPANAPKQQQQQRPAQNNQGSNSNAKNNTNNSGKGGGRGQGGGNKNRGRRGKKNKGGGNNNANTFNDGKKDNQKSSNKQ